MRVKPNEKKVNSLQEEIDDLKNSFNKTRLRDIYQHCQQSEGTPAVIPNIMTLLKLAILCPLGNAVVERLFSLMSLVKTQLRSSLSDVTLDRLLRVNKEGNKELSEEDLVRLADILRELLCSESETFTTKLKF